MSAPTPPSVASAPSAPASAHAMAPIPAWPRAPLLLCSSSSRTGPVESMIALARFLRARGHDARFGGDSVREGNLSEHLDRAQVPWVRTLHLSRKPRLSHLLSDARQLATWVAQGSPDLLHASMSNDHWLAFQAIRRAGQARATARLVRTAHRAIDVAPGGL
ncbi:MAG: glycosyltransferase, partial [Deltaproteobacteria bacterium]|nr:glycosyltransferase [Deltaproteobacteria bacterium]